MQGLEKSSLSKHAGEDVRPIPDEMKIALGVLVWQLLCYALGFLAIWALDPTATPSWKTFEQIWLEGDSYHYLRIAQFGYQPGTEHANLIVFYPLYPLAIRLFSHLTGDYVVSAFAVSTLSLMGAAVMLYRWVRLDDERLTALRAVGFLLLYPFALFLYSCYTESLFILLSVATAYFARKGRWLAAGIMGFLASLTRVQGILLFALAAYEWMSQGFHSPHPEKTIDPMPLRQCLRGLSAQGLYLLLIPMGFVAYLIINRVLYGDFRAYMYYEAQAPWFQGFAFFGDNLRQHVQMAAEYRGLAYVLYTPQWLLFFAVLGLVAVGIKKRVRLSYIGHMLLVLLVSYSASWLLSGGRYMMANIAIYPVLARLGENRTVGFLLKLAMGLWMAFFMVNYLHGQAIM